MPCRLPQMHFSFADCALYLFAGISHSHKCDYTLSPASPSKSGKLGLSQGPLTQNCIVTIPTLHYGNTELLRTAKLPWYPHGVQCGPFPLPRVLCSLAALPPCLFGALLQTIPRIRFLSEGFPTKLDIINSPLYFCTPYVCLILVNILLLFGTMNLLQGGILLPQYLMNELACLENCNWSSVRISFTSLALQMPQLYTQ